MRGERSDTPRQRSLGKRMCGRFIISKFPDEIARWFGTTGPLPNSRARYNAAPTQDIAVVRYDPESKARTLDTLRWGLIPFWAKEAKVGYTMINAKAETVAEKPAFREAFKSRRCLIPADGFYEWKKLDAKTKQPYAFVMNDRSLFGFAGLWDRWTDKASGEVVRSFTIITTTPNDVCAPVHDRMPVIVEPKNYGKWLGEEPIDPVQLLMLLRSFPAEKMDSFAVDPRVGNVRNDDPTLLIPIAA
jgi:putative SOS response-associated peptidase YedK